MRLVYWIVALLLVSSPQLTSAQDEILLPEIAKEELCDKVFEGVDEFKASLRRHFGAETLSSNVYQQVGECAGDRSLLLSIRGDPSLHATFRFIWVESEVRTELDACCLLLYSESILNRDSNDRTMRRVRRETSAVCTPNLKRGYNSQICGNLGI